MTASETRAVELLLLMDEVSRKLSDAACICSGVGLDKEEFMECCSHKWDQVQ